MVDRSPPSGSPWSLTALICTAVLFVLGCPGTFAIAVAISETVDDGIGAASMLVGGAALILLQAAVLLPAVLGLVRREPLWYLCIPTFTFGAATILAQLACALAALSEFI
jgi:hypothetical protein